MGGVAEGGVGIAEKSSPHRAAIEKVQAELRKEYDVREERKRELEFLENGGNPLDFKLGNAASVSVQSTSFTDHHPDLVTSEAKGSFALTASPHGDSVESSGRPRAPPCEPNSADNLMLFNTEHELSEGDRNSFHPSRSNIVPSEQSSPMDGSHQTRRHGDSAAFGLPRKAYKRRNRSRANRDGARSSSNDVNPVRGCHGSSLPSHHGPKDVVRLASDAENLDVSSNCNSKPRSPIDGTPRKSVYADDQQDMELDDAKAVESTEDLIKGISTNAASDAVTSLNPLDDQLNQSSFLDDSKTPIRMDCDGPKSLQATEKMAAAAIEHQPSVDAVEVENQSTSYQMNGFICKTSVGMTNDAHNSGAALGGKSLDSESCSKTNLRTDGNNDTETCTKMRNVDSNGNIKNQTLEPHQASVVEGDELVKEEKETKVMYNSTVDAESASASQIYKETGPSLQSEEESSQGRSALQDKLKDQFNIEGMEAGGSTGSESGSKPMVPLNDNSCLQNEKFCKVINNGSTDISICDLPEAESSTKVATVTFKVQTRGPNLKLANIDEDSILEEAEIIEAKRKRISELSILDFPMEIRCKSHWDNVLEEMTWLANDFAQERIWKIAASAQLCKRAAFTSRVWKQEKSSDVKAKKVASTLATAVMEFWHLVEKTRKELQLQNQKDGANAVQSYAARFLKYNNSNILYCQTEVPLTPDRISDSGILDMSWEDNLTEENLFYAVAPGAMETYRKSIESHVAQCEKIGSNVQEEVETSACDAVTDFESQDNSYYEDEGETSTHDISVAYANSKSSRFGQKKRKHSTHAYGARLYEIGSDLLPLPMPTHTQCAENKIVTQQSALLAKRPASSLNVSIPTKRVRTASRRIMSPFSAGTSGCVQVPNKADASSGDTNSFQDDQTTLLGGSFFSNNLEVESAGEFEKHLPFDSAEVSTKPKKKKKAKHPNAAFDQRWKIDSNFQNEQFQKDHLKKRSESHQLDSNGCNGLLSQPVIKKIIRQSHDGAFDNIAAIGGPVPSPAASQMSNMSNTNKFYKMLGGRDRGRKPKTLKTPVGQPGSGSPWSLFEDQALVVLVHDMGSNWELVSDAFNDILQFKCICRKAKECKERHNILMDRTSGDGADSAEDSGSSQSYPSTLPGIPKGSARQLFQRLKEPMEEDTIKSHREKIITIGQKLQYRKTQDPKQLQQPHSSHTIALSQFCPNNLSGGSILSPLDLCDASGPDILSIGHQGPYSSGLTIPNQGSVPTMLPSSGAGSSLQGSSNMMLGNNFSSSPGSLSSSVRDGRYGVPRSASLSIDEQQRMQQYNQMLSGRNIQQPNMSAPGALPGIDRGGVRILPGGNGIGMMCVNRSMPMARPGFQGVVSSSMVNSGSMVSPGMSSANMHSGVGSGQGNSTLRPREAIHMMRPGLSQDSQRPMMVPDLPMQVSPGNGQGVSHFGGLSSPFPNQTASPPVSSYPLQHQQSHPISPQQPQVLSPHHPHFQGQANHAPNPQQQAYAIRLAKERQLPHRFLQQQPQQQQQQQQQFAASNSLMSHVQPQPHLPASSPMQNSPHVQSQASSPSSLPPLASASSMNAMPQQQQKHQAPTQGVIRNAQTGGSGLTNQVNKQRQRQQQQFSQTNRQHPQQRQQSQSQQQAKVMKGIGRGNLMRHQNIPIDSSVLNGVSTNLGNQSEKGDPITSLMETQGLQTGASLNAVQPTRQYVSSQSSNQSLPQQKKYSGQASSLSTHLHQMTSHSDNNSQVHVPPLAPPASFHISGASSPTATTPTTNSSHFRSSPHLLFAKPSHFINHAKRNHRLHVSCTAANGGQNQNETSQNVETSQGKVDRRNMLLGLGGLYGAANLISTPGASANPIQPPQLDKCGTASLETGEKLKDSCCPPVTQTIVDYKLPAVFKMKMRPSAHRASPEYIYKYNLAIDRMKRLPADDPRSFMQQANIHCAYCNGAYDQPGQGTLDLQVHNSWLFFPFHRWYLYFYERILGKLINDPTFALPFWNWDNPKGMTMPPMFVDPKAAIYDSKRNQANLPPAVVDLGMTGSTDPIQNVANNLTIMYTEMIRGNSSATDFMGQPYIEGTAPNPGPGASERGSHTAIHVWVGDPREPSGEDLGNFYSAGRDPLFYCHHANVDRMWMLWQYYLPSSKVPDKKITDPDFLNAAFLFYDENAQLVRVTVKDTLDNLKMGFDYERIDLPWLDYRPPAQTAKAKITRTSTAVPKAEALFPLKLESIVRFEVPKTKKGKANEILVLENITVDTTKFLKFDVFVNDEDDNPGELDKAAYAGTYAQVPHKTNNKTASTSIRLKLTDLYDDMDVSDDDTIIVTLVPRHKGPGVTIGGIKIIEDTTATATTTSSS